jgi:hypothetical protein
LRCATQPFSSFIGTPARLLGPGSVRSIVGESLLNDHLLNVNHFRQRCLKTRPDTPITPISLYNSNRLCFIHEKWCARGDRTPGLLVRSQWSENAKCPIWRRLRIGNAILPSIRCTQSCTQNRLISNLTVYFKGSIRKAFRGLGERILNHCPPSPEPMDTNGQNNNSPETGGPTMASSRLQC